LSLTRTSNAIEWDCLLAPPLLSSSGVESPASLFRLCVATISIYSSRARVGASESARQTAPWAVAFGTVVRLCFQIVNQIALARPELVLPASAGSPWTASIGDKRQRRAHRGNVGVATLACEVTWAYFVRQLVQTLRFATCSEQLVIASHLLAMATAETHNEHSELLVVSAGDTPRPIAGGGYVLQTLDYCLRRIWPQPKHIVSIHQQPETVHLDSIAHAVSITKHACQVCFASHTYIQRHRPCRG
jgi:hypothetical protein